MDLIQRTIFLKTKGNPEPFEKLNSKFTSHQFPIENKINVEDIEIAWDEFSSEEFGDTIKEDETRYLIIKSQDFKIQAIIKLEGFNDTSIAKGTTPKISFVWLFSFPQMELQTPKKIKSPHYFTSPLHRIGFDIKQMILAVKKQHTTQG